ncbi:hypothetical protein [Sporosarcina sp. FSL K6-5500]|uniref:hypothetical protein n=1 Tax=Sporosarcina sp. FSL K6-5500 TaxID=2921558 RepID=UPI0030F7B4EA
MILTGIGAAFIGVILVLFFLYLVMIAFIRIAAIGVDALFYVLDEEFERVEKRKKKRVEKRMKKAERRMKK